MFGFAATGCVLGTGNFAGKSCTDNTDCPSPYVCALVRADGPTCELVRGVDFGQVKPTKAVDYCHDVKPILDKSCVSNCHGADTSQSSRSDFRLDGYAFTASVQGAFAFAARIKVRTQEDSMPPVGITPRTTQDERLTIANWVAAGAPECLDGGR